MAKEVFEVFARRWQHNLKDWAISLDLFENTEYLVCSENLSSTDKGDVHVLPSAQVFAGNK